MGISFLILYTLLGIFRSDFYSMRAEISLIAGMAFFMTPYTRPLRRFFPSIILILVMSWIYFSLISPEPAKPQWLRGLDVDSGLSFRLFGVTTNPNHEAFLILLAMLTTSLPIRVILLAPLVLTFSRAGILCGIFLMTSLPPGTCFRSTFLQKKWLVPLAGLLALFWIHLAVHGNWESVLERYLSSDTPSSISVNVLEYTKNLRLDMGEWTIGQIKQRPWLGFGPRSFNEHWITSSPYHNQNASWLPWTPHNNILWLLHSSGIIGAGLFVLGFAFALPRFSLLWLIGLHSIFDSILSNYRITFFLPLFFLFASAENRNRQISKNVLWVLIVLGLGTVFFLLPNYYFYDESIIRQTISGYLTSDPGHTKWVIQILSYFSQMDLVIQRGLFGMILIILLSRLKTELRFLVLAVPTFLIQLITLRPYFFSLSGATLAQLISPLFWFLSCLFMPTTALIIPATKTRAKSWMLFLCFFYLAFYILFLGKTYPIWQSHLAPWVLFSAYSFGGIPLAFMFSIVGIFFRLGILDRTTMMLIPFLKKNVVLGTILALTFWLHTLYTKYPRGKLSWPTKSCWVENPHMAAYFRQNNWPFSGVLHSDLGEIMSLPVETDCLYRSPFKRIPDQLLKNESFNKKDRFYLFDVKLELWERLSNTE